MRNLLNYKFSRLGLFYKKDTESCLTEKLHQNRPNDKVPFSFRFITTIEFCKELLKFKAKKHEARHGPLKMVAMKSTRILLIFLMKT